MDARLSPRTKLTALVAAAAGAVATLAASAPMSAAARGTTQTLASGRLASLVAGAGRLFALSGSEVVTFDDDGQTLGRCARFAPPPPQSQRSSALGAPDADEVLRAAGLDDDGSSAAEELLEDEGLGPKRRPRPQPDAGILPRALASDARGAGAVWIATSSGLFRGDEHGCLPAGLDGRDLLYVAAAGSTVVAATEDLLFRRAADPDTDEGGDDVASFTVAVGLAERPRALALGADGAALVADDDGVLEVGGDGATARILDRPVDALAVCGGEALALADDGVYRWRPGAAPVRSSDRPPIRGIACGAGGTRWIGTGLGVWTSPDGATWTERAETLGRSVAGAAGMGPRTWLAIDNALVPLDLTRQARAPSPIFRSFQSTAALDGTGMPPLPTGRLGTPPLPWPVVTALFGAERRTPDRRGWQVMVLLTFPFDHLARRRADPTLVAAERVRRDAALAREQIDLATGNDDPDGVDDDPDERDARLDSVVQEREALR